MNPTHTLYVVDNFDGQGDRYWIFEYVDSDEAFRSCYTAELIICYPGGEILKIVDLT